MTRGARISDLTARRALPPTSAGAQVHGQRLRVGWGLRIAARRAGVSPSMLSGVERGRRVPSAAWLGRVALGWDLTPGQRARLLATAEPAPSPALLEAVRRAGLAEGIALTIRLVNAGLIRPPRVGESHMQPDGGTYEGGRAAR